MACMEHVCNNCEHLWFNNDRPTECPECGSQDIASFWDEAYSYRGEEE